MGLIFVEETKSTNAYAKSNIESLKDRDVVYTDVQTNGRGRLGRTWKYLGTDNIYMSIILKPSDKFHDIYSNLTQYLSVVLSQILEEHGLEPQIKWPNDVLINGKKISGILCETVMQGHDFKGLVLGIGINLNATTDELSAIEKPTTSLNIELNRTVDKKEFIQILLDKFFLDYDEFLGRGFILIKDYYIEHASFLNKKISINILNNVKHGFAKGVTNYGALIFDNEIITIGDIL